MLKPDRQQTVKELPASSEATFSGEMCKWLSVNDLSHFPAIGVYFQVLFYTSAMTFSLFLPPYLSGQRHASDISLKVTLQAYPGKTDSAFNWPRDKHSHSNTDTAT